MFFVQEGVVHNLLHLLLAVFERFLADLTIRFRRVEK